jgi:putative colanic acid biosynthesis acetyltransferase WcaF
MVKTDLSRYNNFWYKPGASFLKRAIWYIVNASVFNSHFPFNSIKIFLLKFFGAQVGKGVVIKPRVNIKYPWNISIGSYVWVGEGVWLDSLTTINIGSNSCISQGAMLICGNHNYKKATFDLMIGEIILEEGVWIGTGGIVCGGVSCKSHSVLTAGSVTSSNLEPYSVYRGNPAIKLNDRIIAAD